MPPPSCVSTVRHGICRPHSLVHSSPVTPLLHSPPLYSTHSLLNLGSSLTMVIVIHRHHHRHHSPRLRPHHHQPHRHHHHDHQCYKWTNGQPLCANDTYTMKMSRNVDAGQWTAIARGASQQEIVSRMKMIMMMTMTMRFSLQIDCPQLLTIII